MPHAMISPPPAHANIDAASAAEVASPERLTASRRTSGWGGPSLLHPNPSRNTVPPADRATPGVAHRPSNDVTTQHAYAETKPSHSQCSGAPVPCPEAPATGDNGSGQDTCGGGCIGTCATRHGSHFVSAPGLANSLNLGFIRLESLHTYMDICQRGLPLSHLRCSPPQLHSHLRQGVADIHSNGERRRLRPQLRSNTSNTLVQMAGQAVHSMLFQWWFMRDKDKAREAGGKAGGTAGHRLTQPPARNTD